MYQEMINKYYVNGNNNCAETLMRVAQEAYGVEISENALHALGAFGGGMGCGETCGALAGAVAAIGCAYIDTVGHDSPKAKELAAAMTRAFIDNCGSTRCQELKTQYFVEGRKCASLCEFTAKLLGEVAFDK